MKCKIVKIDVDLAVKAFLQFLVLLFSSANISLVSESKISHCFPTLTSLLAKKGEISPFRRVPRESLEKGSKFTLTNGEFSLERSSELTVF